MGVGEIRDFTKPDAGHNREGITEIRSSSGVTGPIEILDAGIKQQGVTPVVTMHEEVIVEGSASVRGRKPKKGEPEIKLRSAIDKEAWDKVKRLDDE